MAVVAAERLAEQVVEREPDRPSPIRVDRKVGPKKALGPSPPSSAHGFSSIVSRRPSGRWQQRNPFEPPRDSLTAATSVVIRRSFQNGPHRISHRGFVATIGVQGGLVPGRSPWAFGGGALAARPRWCNHRGDSATAAGGHPILGG